MLDVTCPKCQVVRTVSKVQAWRLSKGLRKHCKSCSIMGRKYPARAGIGFTTQAKAAQQKVILGNSFAKGHKRPLHLIEADRIRMTGNKFAAGIRGAAHHSWKGGRGTERHRVMASVEYREWREAVFIRDNYTCQICEQYAGFLHADHIERWTDNKKERFSVSNGRTLCRACHYYVTFKRIMPPTSKWGLVNVIKKEG